MSRTYDYTLGGAILSASVAALAILQLKEEFPEAIVLVPSWSGSWYDGTIEYLDDMYKDVKRRKSLSIRKPCLLAISAGGPAGFRIYNGSPERFACLVSLASAPPRGMVPALKKDLRILMINGKEDTGFPIASVEAVAAQLADRLPRFQFRVLDDDHFFLLSNRETTFRIIRAFLAKETDGRIHGTGLEPRMHANPRE